MMQGRSLHRCLGLAIGMCWLTVAQADLSQYHFDQTEDAQHFKALLSEIRCLVCQNQSLADSDADLAGDLRLEVYKLVQSGHSDAEVIQFLVERYGEFVRYRPAFKPATYWLWFAPLLLFVLFLVIVLKAINRQRKLAVVLSDEQRKKLERLLRSDRESE